MSEAYSLNVFGGVVRDADNANIPADEDNTDYRAYLAWVAAGNAPTPYTPPPPIYNCQLWQLQAVLTSDQWGQVQATIVAQNNPVLSAFAAHGANMIPSNSMTLIALGATIGLSAPQVAELVKQASTISIP